MSIRLETWWGCRGDRRCWEGRHAPGRGRGKGAGLLGARVSLVWKEKKHHQRKPVFPAGLLSGLEGEDPFNQFLWVGLVVKKMHLALDQLSVKWQQGFSDSVEEKPMEMRMCRCWLRTGRKKSWETQRTFGAGAVWLSGGEGSSGEELQAVRQAG